ncbi:MAG: sugar ABC transporter ATP-binding protein [Candidatus Sulfopaludibacter sp.]|nr:sugar ABC transporter ATP-binding protein [Candidatus Sulfopaludibacter sp.]
MSTVLQLDRISKSFGGILAVDDVSLTVQAGEIHAVTGENGAGKSTLMKIVAGMYRPDAGAVRFTGRRLAMIHQELLTFPDLTVAENICMGHEPSRWGWLDRPAMRREAAGLLARLGVSLNPSARMRHLSFAERQSVEIAKALGGHADLLIMDEPTSALSDREAELLFRIIGDLKQSGVAVIYISHRMAEIFRLADTITVLRDGRHIATRPAAELDEERLIALMVGRSLEPLGGLQKGVPGETVLEVSLPGIQFSLRAGEILGLAGLLGAGRSEAAAAVFGLVPTAGAHIRLAGRAVRIGSPAGALAHGIAMVTEDRKEYGFVPRMSVRENMTLSSLGRFAWGPVIRTRREAAAVEEQIRRFRVRAAGAGQAVRDLSGGNQQKIVIARALLTRPRVLILDEPTRGIDVGAKAEIYALIAGLAREGMAILLISSEMNEILSLSDRILVMREGAVSAELSPGRTTPEEILRYAMPN